MKSGLNKRLGLRKIIERLCAKWMRKKGALKPRNEAETQVKRAQGFTGVTYNHPEFKKLLQWGKKSEQEQGRIFNEILVGAMIMSDECLMDILPKIPGYKRSFWREVLEELVPAFLESFRQLGAGETNVKMWGRLLEIRKDEFHEREKEATEILLDDFKNTSSGQMETKIRVITIAGMVSMHIEKGKSTKRTKELVEALQHGYAMLSNECIESIAW